MFYWSYGELVLLIRSLALSKGGEILGGTVNMMIPSANVGVEESFVGSCWWAYQRLDQHCGYQILFKRNVLWPLGSSLTSHKPDTQPFFSRSISKKKRKYVLDAKNFYWKEAFPYHSFLTTPLESGYHNNLVFLVGAYTYYYYLVASDDEIASSFLTEIGWPSILYWYYFS